MDQFNHLRSKTGVRQLGVHCGGRALRVTTNSTAIKEALRKTGGSKDVEEKIKKGCEVEKCEKRRR